jgi:hypothetical protein
MSMAMVVVVHMNKDDAWDAIATSNAVDVIAFVGEPWPVEPFGPEDDPKYGTVECIEQRRQQ